MGWRVSFGGDERGVIPLFPVEFRIRWSERANCPIGWLYFLATFVKLLMMVSRSSVGD